MATLYITEYSNIGHSDGARAQVPMVPEVTTQTVAIGGTSTQSSAFNASTKYVRLHTDAICSILFGSNPTATSAKPRMAANQTLDFGVDPNLGSMKVAVITNT